MLRVTADVFSGRENPSWLVSDDSQVRDVLRKLTLRRGALGARSSGFTGLGFRGLVVELADDSLAATYDLPNEFRLAGGAAQDESGGLEIAEQLIGTMPVGETGLGTTELDEDLRSQLREDLAQGTIQPPAALESPPGAEPQPFTGGELADEGQDAGTAAVCPYWATAFNPGFWNTNPSVRSRNNCYNYACNRRTDTFAQPGRAVGQMYRRLDCAEVGRGALADGNRIWGNCFPAGTGGLWLMALVIAPGRDFHWYRYSAEGFWGHKPGSTAATNLDNSGRVIRDPRTANRGIYTVFCGFLQTAYTVRVN